MVANDNRSPYTCVHPPTCFSKQNKTKQRIIGAHAVKRLQYIICWCLAHNFSNEKESNDPPVCPRTKLCMELLWSIPAPWPNRLPVFVFQLTGQLNLDLHCKFYMNLNFISNCMNMTLDDFKFVCAIYWNSPVNQDPNPGLDKWTQYTNGRYL